MPDPVRDPGLVSGGCQTAAARGSQGPDPLRRDGDPRPVPLHGRHRSAGAAGLRTMAGARYGWPDGVPVPLARLRRVRAAAGAGGRLSHRRPHGGGAVRLRGPDPAGVLDLAMERKNIIALKGNHEDAFVDWYDTVPDKIHNRYYYNTYDFLMDSRRTRERLPEYVEFMRKMPLYKKLRIDGECWLLAHACTEEVLSFWKRKERMLWSTEMIDRGKGIPGYHSVVGHVPAFTIRGNTNRPAKIWHSEDGWLTDIDCGAAFPAFGGRLGCLCLVTGEEYYVADAEILTT